jgi:hypothetical protein
MMKMGQFLRRDEITLSAASTCIICFHTLYAPTKALLIEQEWLHMCEQGDYCLEEPAPLECGPATMPAYVFRYSTKDGPMKIEYTYRPDWMIASREAANEHCAALRSHGDYVREHHCEFAVEELTDGMFAIVCATLPESLRIGSPAVHARQPWPCKNVLRSCSRFESFPYMMTVRLRTGRGISV